MAIHFILCALSVMASIHIALRKKLLSILGRVSLPVSPSFVRCFILLQNGTC